MAQIKKEDFQPQWGVSVTNHGGLEIVFDTKNDDHLFYRWNYGQDLTSEPIRKAIIRYNSEGEKYFKVGRVKYYMSDLSRIGTL